MGNLCATAGADAIPTRSSPGTGSSHPTTPLCAPPGWSGSISPGHDITSNNQDCYIGGSPQVPVLHVGQLISEDSDVLEPGLKNEENSRFGFWVLHLGQFNLEPSSPMD